MKRFTLGFILVFALFLTACTNESPIKHQTIFDKITLTFSEGDTNDSVSKDFSLPDVLLSYDQITYEWVSNNPEIAEIFESTVKIKPSETNQITSIRLLLTIDGITKEKVSTFTVKGVPIIEDKTYKVYISDDLGTTIINVLENSKLDFTPDDRIGFTFIGLYVDNSYQIPFEDENITASIVLYAKWQINTYTITFDTNGGSTLSDLVFEFNQVITKPVDPIKTGYTFGGWYTDINLETIFEFSSKPSQDLTLYAKWILDTTSDQNPPTFSGLRDYYVYLNDTIDFYIGVTAVDREEGSVIFEVDDSSVDFSSVGTYDVIYKASDSKGNETIVIKKVYVSALPESTFIEDFSNNTSNSSSYVNGTFIGVTDIEWQYQGMRSDLTIDGKALTFGANSSNYLKATISGGLSGLSVDMKHQFSGADIRIVDLYINGNLIESFNVTSSQLTYEVNDIDIEGIFEIEFRNQGGYRVSLDNIVFKTGVVSKDLKDILLDIKAFDLPSSIMSETTINFQESGLNGSVITYSYSNTANPDNQLINLETGLITMPVLNQVEIDLDVTFTINETVRTITVSIKVGEGDPISILEALDKTGEIKTLGTITAIYHDGVQFVLFIQDESSALVAHLMNIDGLQVGDTIVFKGIIQASKPKVIQNLIVVQKLQTMQIDIIDVDASNIFEYESHIAQVSGVVVKDYLSNFIEVLTTDGVIKVYDKTNLNLFNGLLQANEVVIIGQVVNGSLYLTDGDFISVNDVNYTMVYEVILASTGLSDGSVVQQDITLPVINNIFDLSITWTSSNPALISNTGVVTKPEEPTEVTLTFVVKKGSETVITGAIDIIVSSGYALSAYYQEAMGKQGIDLIQTLSTIISRNYHMISYSATNAVLEIADKHPSGNGYLGIYDHVSITSYNKEHVWPQSSFNEASPYKSDMHHLRISKSATNSARSNYYFNNPLSNTSDWETNHSQYRFYPGDLDKGDIARMLLYMAVRYRNDNFRLVVQSGGRTSNPPARTLGNLAVLLDWHLDDPVDDFERNRNNVIFNTQRNRNPFIDHPELFEEIWTYFMAENGQTTVSSIIDYDTFEYDLSYTNLVNATVVDTYNQRFSL